MNTRLKFLNKVALVTGAGEGIGFEIARQLVNEGASVVLNDIDEKLAGKGVAILTQEGPGKCVSCSGDASDVDFIRSMIDFTVTQFGRLDIVVANAGITLFGNFFEFTVQEFQKVVNLNLKGTFFLVQHAAKQMRKKAEGGRILLMSSTIGLRAYPNLTVYSMTKSALCMMAKSLVLELSPYEITINAIAPGATSTERTVLGDLEYESKWKNLIPLGKIALPADIARPSVMLLSDECRHITGQTWVIDGGWTAASPYPNFNTVQRSEKKVPR
ncbi:MAG: SDR family oxidoreductase [Chitinophagaceae bacterium]|nr:SDR family oxidoreductase [Chitinophagaceae bacterium]